MLGCLTILVVSEAGLGDTDVVDRASPRPSWHRQARVGGSPSTKAAPSFPLLCHTHMHTKSLVLSASALYSHSHFYSGPHSPFHFRHPTHVLVLTMQRPVLLPKGSSSSLFFCAYFPQYRPPRDVLRILPSLGPSLCTRWEGRQQWQCQWQWRGLGEEEGALMQADIRKALPAVLGIHQLSVLVIRKSS